MNAQQMAAVLMIVVPFSSGCLPDTARNQAGCLKHVVPPVTVVAIDVSSGFTDRQAALAQMVVNRSWARLAPEERLVVYTLDGRPDENVPVIEFCRESRPEILGMPDGPKTKEFLAFEARQKARDTVVDDFIAHLPGGTAIPKASRGSRLVEWLQAVPAGIPGQAGARRLIFLSDLRQFSPSYTNSTLPSSGVDLRGFDVDVVILGDGRPAPAPWRRLLAAAGGASLNYYMESLPGRLAHDN